jgi:hypothetical protein
LSITHYTPLALCKNGCFSGPLSPYANWYLRSKNLSILHRWVRAKSGPVTGIYARTNLNLHDTGLFFKTHRTIAESYKKSEEKATNAKKNDKIPFLPAGFPELHIYVKE